VLPLERDAAHLWYVRPETITDPARVRAWAGLLSAAERARVERPRPAAARHDALLTRALVRTALSQHAAVDPRAWAFAPGPHGRPEVAAPRGTGLRFNVSHTSGLIVCAVARRRAIGVDVEDLARPRRTDSLARRFFSPVEVRALGALPPRARRRRFFELWTLKESYLKARGLGLRLPLARLSFRVDPRGRVRVAFDPRLRDDPRRWQFVLVRPTRRHVLALSVRRAPGTRMTVHLHDAVRSPGG
jgi:4'-phosphopantetheinyl transferase